MIRSSVPGLDEAFVAIQGYAGACVVNAVRGVTVFTPFNAGVCFAGVAFIEKLVYQVSSRVIPGSTGFLGPIPIGAKNIVSYGMALYTTLSIMQLTGLISTIPAAVTIIGGTCAAAIVAGSVMALIV
ncbi:MAG: hypothetical protein Q8K75_00670 [Chlamydiales bacterium]|nr:hypothetical protein [Chlamydiales bacterium]